MHKIEFNNISKEFPESISEMSSDQYQYFCYLEILRQTGKIKMSRLEVLFIYYVLDMERVSSAPQVIENINKLRDLVRPYFSSQSKKGTSQKIVELDFVENPLPEIIIAKKKYSGPKTALQDCQYAQIFVYAHNEYLDFSKASEEAHLDRLLAILYHPPGEKFDPELIETRSVLFSGLKVEIKFGVYLFFASCLKFMATCKELSIGGGVTVDLSELFKPDPAQVKMKGIGAIGVIYSIAESRVFGDAEKTGKQGVYDILIRLIQLDQQAKKIKEDAKRNRAK